MRTIATSACEFHDDGVVVGKFHEIDITPILLEVGTHLFEDILDFSEDGFFIHIYVCFFLLRRDLRRLLISCRPYGAKFIILF